MKEEQASAGSGSTLVGRTLGAYQVLSLVGRGGMGEVYRAKDSRLGREVAIKLLPAGFSTNADRLRRFEQEARAAGRLNHPNVLAIHDVGTHEGSPYIVSELLEGQTLRDRLQGTALPLRKAMDYALQIARGLAAAHGKGIVHRDLKPENLFITKDGHVKILDFGLAKLRQKPNAILDAAESTETLNTSPGVIMGTAGYMSPEQVRGDETDHRSDLFSFGAILYEILSGQRAFQGKSAVETMSAILKEEPPELSKTQPDIPPALEHIAQRCLEKTPEQRFQAASDLAFDLEEMLRSTSSSQAPAAGQRRSRERLAWAVAIFLFLVALALAALHFRRAPTEIGVTRFIVPPPPQTTFAPQSTVAVSPDGRHLAFAATSEGKTLLWVRSLDSPLPRALLGTEGAGFPFWSPDSRSIGFFAQQKLKRIEASGGPAVTLCNVAGLFEAGTWSQSGVIIFSLSVWSNEVLYRVPDSGGQAVPVTRLDASRQEEVHFRPQFLPDGRHFLYLASGPVRGGQAQACTIVGSLDSGETKCVLSGYSNATYAPPGYLLFVREGLLHVQPFDTRRLEVTGDPIPLPEQLQDKKGLRTPSLSVSQNGVLAYESGSPDSQLLWFDRGGRPLGKIGEAREYMHVELSPDGTRLAIEFRDRQRRSFDIDLFDLLKGTSTRFTFDRGSSFRPAWSPDGSQLAYALHKQGQVDVIQKKKSNGTGDADVLIEGGGAVSDWSWDGRFIAYEYSPPQGKSREDLWILPLFGDRKPFPFLQTELEENNGRFSPNGRWIAYDSNETGRVEVYVQSFPRPGAKSLVSTNGGRWPRWRRDGKELFYLASDEKLMAVPVNLEGAFQAGVPKALFQTREIIGRYPYAVTPDGQRFLVNTPLEEASTSPITVVLNWTAELKR